MRKLHTLVTNFPGTYSLIGQDEEVNRRMIWSQLFWQIIRLQTKLRNWPGAMSMSAETAVPAAAAGEKPYFAGNLIGSADVPFRIDSPGAQEVSFLKKMVEIRKYEIAKASCHMS